MPAPPAASAPTTRTAAGRSAGTDRSARGRRGGDPAHRGRRELVGVGCQGEAIAMNTAIKLAGVGLVLVACRAKDEAPTRAASSRADGIAVEQGLARNYSQERAEAKPAMPTKAKAAAPAPAVGMFA